MGEQNERCAVGGKNTNRIVDWGGGGGDKNDYGALC